MKKDCQNTAEDTFAKENEWSTLCKFIYFVTSLFCGQCHQFSQEMSLFCSVKMKTDGQQDW